MTASLQFVIIRFVGLLLALSLIGSLVIEAQPPSPAETRLALVETSWDETAFSRRLLRTLTARLAETENGQLLDQSLVQSAVQGLGYNGSLNLTLKEGRQLGAAIGCDYFILGRGRLTALNLGADRIEYRAWVALFFVNARNGDLACFQFLEQRRPGSEDASSALLAELASRLPGLLAALREQSPASSLQARASPEPIFDIDGPPSKTGAESLIPPQILTSSKPAYTEVANTADVMATVDLSVTFLPDGTIGPIEIVRWAGFGLDESAIETARRIRFRPARLKGQPVAARALVQYTFKFKKLEVKSSFTG